VPTPGRSNWVGAAKVGPPPNAEIGVLRSQGLHATPPSVAPSFGQLGREGNGFRGICCAGAPPLPGRIGATPAFRAVAWRDERRGVWSALPCGAGPQMQRGDKVRASDTARLHPRRKTVGDGHCLRLAACLP
jgi:hypothetical protein